MSEPPVLSRSNRQIDPSSPYLRDGIRFTPVPCGTNGANCYYRLQLENANDNIVGIDALDEELRLAGLNIPASAVEGVLNTLFAVLPKYMARTGRAVRLGHLVTLKPYATGSLAHMNDEPDPATNRLEIRATICPALRYSLARVALVNAARREDRSLVVAGGPEGEAGVVDEANESFVTGEGVYVPEQSFDADAPRGRVWLETLSGGRLGRFDVLESSGRFLRIKLHLDAPAGGEECRVVVETYGSRAAAEGGEGVLMRLTRNVRLLRA